MVLTFKIFNNGKNENQRKNRLNLEHDIRCALAEVEPNCKQIVKNK